MFQSSTQMKSRILFFITIFIMPLAQANKEIKNEPEAVPGEYLVKLSDQIDLKSTTTDQLANLLGTSIKSRMEDQNIIVIKRPVIEMQKSVIKSLKQNSYVEIVEPNYIYRINTITANDPLLPKLWGMQNTGQQDSAGRSGTPGVDIGATEAWNIQTGSKEVIVAVIDTGVNYNTTDLIQNIWTNEAEKNGKEGVDDDGNGFVDDIYGYNFFAGNGDPMDDHGHGTHCSGTIGAKGNDGQGIVGVAWNVRIMALKFLGQDGSGSLEAAIRAIDYATKNGAKIMSNSWGGGAYSETLKQAIQRANKAGAIFIAAAGNESNNNDSSPAYPASYNVPNVLSVAAIDNGGELASFSNFGKATVHVAAPGVNIYSTTKNGYESWSGTSMATPHVSGIAVLLYSEFPEMTNIEVRNRIIETVKLTPGLRRKASSRGVANAYLALMNIKTPEDVNDPEKWAFKSVDVSTPHPYKEKSNETYEVKVDGAKEVAIYFEKFKTEAKYDTVKLIDSTGKEVDVYSGENDDTISAVISGDSVKIIFKSDATDNSYGFDISKIYYR